MTEQEAIDIVNEELPKLKGYPKLKKAMRVVMDSVYGYSNTVRIGINGVNRAATRFMANKIEEAVRSLFGSEVDITNETEA